MWRKLEPCPNLQNVTWASSPRTVNDCHSGLVRRMATPVAVKGRYKGDLREEQDEAGIAHWRFEREPPRRQSHVNSLIELPISPWFT